MVINSVSSTVSLAVYGILDKNDANNIIFGDSEFLHRNTEDADVLYDSEGCDVHHDRRGLSGSGCVVKYTVTITNGQYSAISTAISNAV